MIAAIIPLIPAVIGLAEKIFGGEGKGDIKKKFAMGICEKFYDSQMVKIMPDLPGFDEKSWFLAVCDVTIEHALQAIKK